METLWEKLLFWKKKSPKMLEEGVDFHYVDLDLVGAEGQLTGIGLTIKGYEGVLYHYQKACTHRERKHCNIFNGSGHNRPTCST